MSGNFTREDVEQCAPADSSSQNKRRLTPQLPVLAYAEQVQQVATTGVPPTSHPLGTTSGTNVSWRDDIPQASLDRTEALSQAPEADVARGLFKVPRVLA
jgi:aspartyl/glutamyl-tRNA(Asn/Gln) amidotransferase C subunit